MVERGLPDFHSKAKADAAATAEGARRLQDEVDGLLAHIDDLLANRPSALQQITDSSADGRTLRVVSDVSVREITSVSEEIFAAINRLLPVLSSSALPLTFDEVRSLIENESVTLLVAEDGSQVVGMLTLVVFPIPTGIRAWIEDVVVEEPQRGKGVGELLTRAAIEQAEKLGARTVDLTSRPTREAANRLYVRCGFQLRETNVYRHNSDS